MYIHICVHVHLFAHIMCVCFLSVERKEDVPNNGFLVQDILISILYIVFMSLYLYISVLQMYVCKYIYIYIYI